MSLLIVDTGCANLSSVLFAFQRLGASPIISADAETIERSERVILPGVGSAPFAMENIQSKGLIPVLKSLKQPVLGICLGMQLLFEKLLEGGSETNGLGLIQGTIDLLDTQNLPSPHMGWNRLDNLKEDPLTAEIQGGDFAYFVHSYAAPISAATLASAHHGSAFSAIVRSNNVWGCQFHPERSSRTGARILENFLKVEL